MCVCGCVFIIALSESSLFSGKHDCARVRLENVHCAALCLTSDSSLQRFEDDPQLLAMAQSEKLQQIQQDLEQNGPMAVLKYAKDPEALLMFEKIVKLTMS